MNLDRSAIQVVADKYEVPVEMLLALAEVESNGVALWTINGIDLPVIRFEGHYFYKLLSGAERKTAVRLGMADKRAGVVPNPKSAAGRYVLLERAMKINNDAALMSISMGLGQVMGIHYRMLGFASPDAMFAHAKQGITAQVELMAQFIAANPRLKKAMNALDFQTVARLYNGPAYKRNKYDTKIAVAYFKYRAGDAISPSMVSVNSKYIEDIKSLGYTDVVRFQKERGLAADGIIGPATIAEIAEVRTERAKAQIVPKEDAAKKVGVGAASIGTIAVVITQLTPEVLKVSKEAIDNIAPSLGFIKNMGTYGVYAATAITAIMAASAVYIAVQKYRLSHGATS